MQALLHSAICGGSTTAVELAQCTKGNTAQMLNQESFGRCPIGCSIDLEPPVTCSTKESFFTSTDTATFNRVFMALWTSFFFIHQHYYLLSENTSLASCYNLSEVKNAPKLERSRKFRSSYKADLEHSHFQVFRTANFVS